MNEATSTGPRPNMSAPTASDDLEFRVHAAWLAQVSEAADGLLVKQVPQQGGSSPSISPSSLEPADRLLGQQVRLAPPSRRGRRSGLIIVIVGSIFAVALAAVIAIPPHLALFESWQQPTGDRTIELGSSEPPTSAIPAMGSETPKLIVEPSLGVAGEPVPIGLALRGLGNDATVIIRGLLPGMELSAGGAIAGDTWQLSAADLPYAWIAPPQDFVGSADLVAELRLPNAQIADRQALHVKWTRPAAGPSQEQEREQIAPRQENEMRPPIAPPTVQHPNERDLTTAAPPISAEPSQGQIDREEGKSAHARGKNNLRRSVNEGDRRAPLATPHVGDSKPAVKGFWDWSR